MQVDTKKTSGILEDFRKAVISYGRSQKEVSELSGLGRGTVSEYYNLKGNPTGANRTKVKDFIDFVFPDGGIDGLSNFTCTYSAVVVVQGEEFITQFRKALDVGTFKRECENSLRALFGSDASVVRIVERRQHVI